MRLQTKYGDYYDIDANGNIIRLDIPGFKASGQWKLLGIQHVKRNEFIPFESLGAWLATKPELLFKNGAPQYTVRDLDHGTMRTWGNTKCHGIAALWI